MFWLIGYAIFGLFAGLIARLLHPGHDPMNWFWTFWVEVTGLVWSWAAAGTWNWKLRRHKN